MNILGINAYHGDASACILKDNKIIAAAEEERFTRIKHSAGFPIHSINYCLDEAGLNINQLDHITINRNPKQKIFSKIIYASFKLFNYNFIKNRISNIKRIQSIKKELEQKFNTKIKAKINNIDHHTSHIASSVYFSGFKNSNFISVDGFGDFVSTVTGFYDGNKIIKYKEVKFPHSLGIFYTAMTQYLGFNNYGDEYKVMGLAPYGKPIYTEKLKDIISYDKNELFSLNLNYFLHHLGNVDMTWLDGEPKIGRVFSEKLIDHLGPVRKKNQEILKFHKDIACSTQKIYEEIFMNILKELHKLNNNKNLCISGGCGMNSVANGKILKNLEYKNIYIPSAPGDSGGAIGSATYVNNTLLKKNYQYSDVPYTGPQFTNSQIKDILKKYKKEFILNKINYKFINSSDELFPLVAKKISEGQIVGHFRGRMEWGPRALGNRSILADPRNPKIREIINLKIKRRENFRPFAPSILEEFTDQWFEVDDKVPFMSKVYQVKTDKISKISAVTHVDGSGRLQTVSKTLNENYYLLLKEFFSITDVPILLNTSFNENEPIVCHPNEALDCFLRTKMDALVLEDFIIWRE